MSTDGDTDGNAADEPDSEAISPYTLQHEDASETRHAFWADTVADRIETREPDEPIVIKGGISPSGVPHLGNVNEIMRGYFVAEALRERGFSDEEVDQIMGGNALEMLSGERRSSSDAGS